LSWVIVPDPSVSNWLKIAYSIRSSKKLFTSKVATMNSV
jgi:hypothetical protein